MASSFLQYLVPGLLPAAILFSGVPAYAASPSGATTAPLGLQWRDFANMPIEGKGWRNTPSHYHRLPTQAQDLVSTAVWSLAANTSGLAVRFVTDSTSIAAQWDGGTPMNHMAATGSHGLDLYELKNGTWTYAGTGRPTSERTTAVLVRQRPARPAEFLLYLPTYSSVTTLTLGLKPGSRFLPAPPRKSPKPIVFYGTSITQGGCASRAGMGHTAILGRWLNREVINLGFSGGGKSEPAMMELISELDPAIFVLEPLPNMTLPQVTERIPKALEILRKVHPETPILLVANPNLPDDAPQNQALRRIYDSNRSGGDDNLYYLVSKGQLTGREEGTVDGIHPTDLGFSRMARAYEPVLRRLLK